MESALPGVTPKIALGTALPYMQKYWCRLTRFTERGDLLTNINRCENAVRPFVVGRKAWSLPLRQGRAGSAAGHIIDNDREAMEKILA